MTIPYFADGDIPSLATVNPLEAALGLPPSTEGALVSEVWDAIAHACGLPDTRENDEWWRASMWNQAVDIANERAAQ